MIRLTLALLAASLSVAPVRAEDAAPLRIGLVEAPIAGPLFVARGADGTVDGVTKDLAADLARSLGRAPVYTVFLNTGAATEATHAGTLDVTFMPVDALRRGLVAFGPGYYQLESTYLVSAASGITTVDQVDRPGLRVIAIAGTTTFRASARTLHAIQPIPVPSVAEALALMQSRQADAFALSRDTLQPMLAQVPGARIAAGSFQQTVVAVAVPQGQPESLAAVSTWLDGAKASGLVRRVFDAHGLRKEAVAP